MIYYFSPFSVEKNLGAAYNQHMALIGDDDYAVLTDGDTCFLTPDYGMIISQYIAAHPNAVLTCWTNRINEKAEQQWKHAELRESSDMKLHLEIAKEFNSELVGESKIGKSKAKGSVGSKIHDVPVMTALGIGSVAVGGVLAEGIGNESEAGTIDSFLKAAGKVFTPTAEQAVHLTKPAVNSEGKLINESVEGLFNFHNWFGDSKVVDKTNKPLVMYHGSNSEKPFTVFDVTKQQKNESLNSGSGFYFTKDKNYAEGYTKTYAEDVTGNIKPEGFEPRPDMVMATYLKIDNPAPKELVKEWRQKIHTAEAAGRNYEEGRKLAEPISKQMAEDLQAKGYDGFYAVGDASNPSEVVVFKPEQIKSVSNKGDFSPSNADILLTHPATVFGVSLGAAGLAFQSNGGSEGGALVLLGLASSFFRLYSSYPAGERTFLSSVCDQNPKSFLNLYSCERSSKETPCSSFVFK